MKEIAKYFNLQNHEHRFPETSLDLVPPGASKAVIDKCILLACDAQEMGVTVVVKRHGDVIVETFKK